MASIAAYPAPLRAALPIAETDIILFGLVLGFADTNSQTNSCRTTREPVAANITGMATKKENSAAVRRSRPVNNPPKIVAADRLVPGTSASI